MKKALAILLTAVMLLGVLTACGSKKDDAADDTQNTEDADKAAAEAQVKEMCEKLLANTVIESYRVEVA